ncbi:MAG: hypothetical protein WCK33_08410 [Phycisphaerae bacterium]|jgi:type II secretory pathway pseudopilin PulG
MTTRPRTIIPSAVARRSRREVGAILLECLLALALLVAAGVTVLACLDRASDSVARRTQEVVASQVAATALALIESGAMTPETVQGPASRLRDGVSVAADWNIAIDTEPSEFGSLTLVTVRIFAAGRSADADRPPLAVARQLVDLGAVRDGRRVPPPGASP